MPRGDTSGRGQVRNIPLGIIRLATGHADGLAQFRDTTDAFLASLAPLVAFPLVGGALTLLGGGGVEAVSELLATLCALLAPLVLSFEAARLFGRAAQWYRFAVAFNWCQWAIPMAAVLLVMLAGVLMALGLPNRTCVLMLIGMLVAYGLWLHWFLARHGLSLRPGQALLLVLGVNVVSALLILAPQLLIWAAGGSLADG